MARRPNNPEATSSKPKPLPARSEDAHKGDFGRVLIIGGSVGMSGAPTLAGLAALRSGAGLVTIAVPESIQPVVAAGCPCATTMGLPESLEGRIAWAQVHGLPPCEVVVVGPGIGQGENAYARACWRQIDWLRCDAQLPVIIDADALNLASMLGEDWRQRPHPRTILTPHPGELSRLLGRAAEEIQADRKGAVRDMLAGLEGGEGEDGPVVVLKGAGTLVGSGRRLYQNSTGNPGMATGGSGDVLSGMIAALVGQGLSLFDAAATAVYVHGLAGDLAVAAKGETSLIATDIIEALPAAFMKFSRR